MTRILTPLLLLGAMIAIAPAAAPRVSDTQKVVFLSEAGPVLIELYLRIDGKPYHVAYDALMTKVFDYLDKNKDGVLSKAEADAAPPASTLAGPAVGFRTFGGPGGPNMDANGDGKVTREELVAHYQRTGLKSFGVSLKPKDTGIINLNTFGQDKSSPEAINQRLFDLLDADKDGKLSRQELAAGAVKLAGLDENEDEMLTAAELQGRGVSNDYDGQVLFAVDGEMALPSGKTPIHHVSGQAADDGLGKRLLRQYGKKDAKVVSRKELGVSPATFEWLDLNKDDALDAKELARFGQLNADARFTIRLGKRADQQPIVDTDKANDRVKCQALDGVVALTMGNMRFDLRGPERDENIKFNIDVKGQYVTQFRMADTDSNGYLDKPEAEKSGFFRAIFGRADADGDGMLYEKELLAYVDGVEALRQAAERSCLTLTVADEGRGLFERIDTNGDGRLGVRELRLMAKLLDQLDDDKDGKLARGEVPKRYKGSFDLGSAAGGPSGARAIVLRSGMEAPPTPKAQGKGPAWFRKMDRNRDGDVSLKEWLGTEDEFRAVDTDGDGLISLAEAEAFDKRTRKPN